MDDRANLFMQYKRVLEMVQPKVFIFENEKITRLEDGYKEYMENRK